MRSTHTKTGIIIPDFNALRLNAAAYQAFCDFARTRAAQTGGVIILSQAPVQAAQTALRGVHETIFLTDTRTLSASLLMRLCTALYRFDGTTATPMPVIVPDSPAQARIGLFVSNGYGLGHVTRMSSLAAELSAHAPCAFISLSAGLVQNAFYLPSPQYLDLQNKSDARAYMHEAVLRFFNAFNPTHMVYDGNVLPAGLLSALSLRPDIHLTWLRRGMWQPNVAPTYMSPQALCDVVLEPGDIADAADTGPSWHTRLAYCPPRAFLKTLPIRPAHAPLLARPAARHALNLNAHAPHALIMLGATQKQEDAATLHAVVNAVRQTHTPVIAHWPMSHSTPPAIDGAITIERMPLAPYYNAFDVIISAAGYNSYHELLATDRPLIFIPQEDAGRDQQLARATYADAQGWARLCRRNALDTLSPILQTLTPQPRPAIPFHTDTQILLDALGIQSGKGGMHAIEKTGIKTAARLAKAMHRRRKGKPTGPDFVFASSPRALEKLSPQNTIIITGSIDPVILRRGNFKYLWLNAGGDIALKRQLFSWLSIWNPARIKSV